MNKKLSKILSGLLVALTLFSYFPVGTVFAAEGIDPNFNPGMIITDQAFKDVDTFGSAAGIPIIHQETQGA
jgi:hypothetical protein